MRRATEIDRNTSLRAASGVLFCSRSLVALLSLPWASARPTAFIVLAFGLGFRRPARGRRPRVRGVRRYYLPLARSVRAGLP